MLHSRDLPKAKRNFKGRNSQSWVVGKFMKRNPSLRLRVGDSTAGVRFDAINEEYEKLFQSLKEDIC